mmetsp:Transcript_12035/g.37073  ORF Transcript_12035/g.37073 Transcript_12035/m.37073 type:complete len:247 (+) Transcript_12035:255-995(+)
MSKRAIRRSSAQASSSDASGLCRSATVHSRIASAASPSSGDTTAPRAEPTLNSAFMSPATMTRRLRPPPIRARAAAKVAPSSCTRLSSEPASRWTDATATWPTPSFSTPTSTSVVPLCSPVHATLQPRPTATATALATATSLPTTLKFRLAFLSRMLALHAIISKPASASVSHAGGTRLSPSFSNSTSCRQMTSQSCGIWRSVCASASRRRGHSSTASSHHLNAANSWMVPVRASTGRTKQGARRL